MMRIVALGPASLERRPASGAAARCGAPARSPVLLVRGPSLRG
jgi:hypothetical protein